MREEKKRRREEEKEEKEEKIHHKGTEDTMVTQREDMTARANELSHQVVGAAIEVHRTLGPGLLESAYQECLCRELYLREIPYERQVALPVEYKWTRLEAAYRLDLVVGGLVVVELKSVESIEPVHEAQLLTYLRLSGIWLGLLINFNVPLLKQGLYRRVLG